MDKGIKLLLFKGGQACDVSQLVQQVSWRGRKGASARTLSVTLIDDDGYKHARSGLDVEQGQQCIFSYDGRELFRGIIMQQTQNSKKQLSFIAYDNGIYLANNKDTFVYENKTASEIFRDCCNRFGLQTGEVVQCSYKIPELIKSKTTAFDAVADALSLDFAATGIRHYVASDQGRLSLLTRRENILQWVLEVGQNIVSFSYSKSIEGLKTRVKLLAKEGTVLAEKSRPDVEEKIGVFQEIEQPEESLSEAHLRELVASMLEEKSTPKKALDLEALGIVEVISGIGVYVIIPELDLARPFYVDSDVHTFKDRQHTMSLKLNYANDLTKEDKSEAAAAAFKVGDVVQFAGGYHYVSSNASQPTGAKCTAGPAKITLQAKGAKHPWHLVHTDGSSRVYGWVDDGSFS